MFDHAGNCYIALPAHVAGHLPRITVTTAAPVVSDQATVQKPFWDGMDLAVAVADRGVLDDRCTASLDDLKPTRRSRGVAQALLLRVTPLGEEERLPIRVLDRSYLYFIGEVTRPGDAIGQGTSGAFAFAASRPIGMAITHDDPTRARFMRAEEIVLNLGRYLSDQGNAFRASAPTQDTVSAPPKGLPIGNVTTNSAPTLPQFGPDNLIRDGIYVTRPSGPVEITLRLDSAGPKVVHRVRLNAPSEGYAVPRDIIISLDAGEDGSRFRFWTRGQMTPDGVFDTGLLAPRNARWVRIVLRSAWGDGKIGLDRVTVE